MADAPDARLSLDRIALAVEALIWTLGDDARAQHAYAAWQRRVFATALPIGDGRAVILLDAVVETVRRNQPDDLAMLTRLVTDELALTPAAHARALRHWRPKALDRLRATVRVPPAGVSGVSAYPTRSIPARDVLVAASGLYSMK